MQRIAPLIPLRNRQRQRRIKNRRQRIHKRHIRLNARETFGSHIRHGTHQQATGGTAIGHRASRRRQTGTLQRTHGINEILKRMLLIEQMPLLIPSTTHLTAAANVRHRIKHTTIKHADARHRESRIRTDLIRAIPGNEHRRITRRHIPAPHQGNRNALAIAGGNPHPALHVFARFKSTKHRGTPQQAILAGRRIDIMQFAGTRVTGERVAHAGRIIRRIASHTNRIQAPGLPRHRIGGRTIR